MPIIITTGEGYPIQPKDIDTSRHFFDEFGHNETEVSANWVIRFLQERGRSWEPFTYEDINSFYSRKFSDGFSFNRLVEPEMVPPSLARAFAGYRDSLVPEGGGWIVLADTHQYFVTDEFINRCHKASQICKQFLAS
jgi:hypothetical protein